MPVHAPQSRYLFFPVARVRRLCNKRANDASKNAAQSWRKFATDKHLHATFVVVVVFCCCDKNSFAPFSLLSWPCSDMLQATRRVLTGKNAVFCSWRASPLAPQTFSTRCRCVFHSLTCVCCLLMLVCVSACVCDSSGSLLLPPLTTCSVKNLLQFAVGN